jgi:mannose-1-phosphate guanylyltransferase/mannose-6-phosphate isomerase
LEPKPLNTLPAISACARIIYLKDRRANLLVLPSDQYIKGQSEFKSIAVKALGVSDKGFLCLIGVKPDNPCGGYGYIKTGKMLFKGVYRVKSFKEKPAFSEAQRLFVKKGVFWNSGIFCFRADAVLDEIEEHLPKLHSQISRVKLKKDIYKVWNRIRPVSIDYGLIEKTKNLCMVEARFYWRDLGSWDAVYNELPKDSKNNVFSSNCVSLESNGNFIFSADTNRLITTVGIKNLIIVDTKDALLICNKSRAQDVKKIVEILKLKHKSCV